MLLVWRSPEEKTCGEHHADKRKMTHNELRRWGVYLLGG